MKKKNLTITIISIIVLIVISISIYMPVTYAETTMKEKAETNIRVPAITEGKEEASTEEKVSDENKTKKENIVLLPQKGYVKVKSLLSLRKTASSNAKSILTLKPGDVVTILSSKKTWYEVKTSSGKVGYVLQKYIGTKSNKEYKLLKTYTTYSSSSPEGRNYNMNRASEKIEKITLKSGETFNWFDVVGSCGKEQGYKVANVIIDGEVFPGYGGGVCQVATTLYGCTRKLKMQTIERHDHSAGVSYLNRDGYEAAVAYGVKNFKFKNTTDKDIVFDFYVSRGRVIVAAFEVL